LRKTGRCLSKWEKGIYSNTKVLMHASLLVILHFDMAQDNRRLYPEELDIRARWKRKFIALAVVERARKKQCVCGQHQGRGCEYQILPYAGQC
jgi:hypothetical protein